jgi:hypothetical protein
MDPKEMLLKHFEKVLLGAGVAWLALVTVGFTSDPEGFGIKDKLQVNIEKIRAYTSSHKASQPPLPDWASEVRQNLLPKKVPAAKEFPGWALHNRPNLVYSFAGIEPGQEPVHEAPINVTARTDRGKITVSWEESEDNALVLVDTYEVLRKAGDSGEWSSAEKDLSGDTKEWADTNVSPRQRYYYRVVSYAIIDSEHPLVSKAQERGQLKELKKEKRKRESGVTGPHQTPRILIIVPNNVTLPTEKEQFDNVDAPATVSLTVYKWDPEAKRAKNGWVSKNYFIVKEGTQIGTKFTKSKREMDFRAGILKKASIVKRDHPTMKGQKKSYFEIIVKYKDNSEESFNNYQEQKELDGIWKPK